jgi:hypothetical protein
MNQETAMAPINVDFVPTLNGKELYEVDIDKLEDRPWMMPGADKTDYFNYGFDEQTWRYYSQKQAAIRRDSQMKQTISVLPHTFLFLLLLFYFF